MTPPAADSLRVLVVDDDLPFAQTLAEMLAEIGCQAVVETSPQHVLGLAMGGTFDAAFVDLVMPDVSGTELATHIRAADPDLAVMILTGQPGLDSAIQGIQRGVFDYLLKESVGLIELRHAVLRASDHTRLARENRTLLAQLQKSRDFLEALDQISAYLSAESDLQRLLDRLAAAAKSLCHAEASRVVLVHALPTEGWVVSECAGDEAEFLRGARFRHDESILMGVATGAPAVTALEARSHPQFSARCDELPAHQSGFVCAPVRCGLVAGALAVAGTPGGSFEGEPALMAIRLATHAAMAVDSVLERDRAINFFTHTSNILVNLLDSLDIAYSGHSRRVAVLSDMVTRRLGMSDDERRHVHFGALLHDIGKMHLGLGILGSDAVFSDRERQIVRQHPTLGVEMLRSIVLWEEILPIVQSHHEWWDGSGYPNGLAGEAIPLGARVVAVAEVFEAMTRTVAWAAKRTPAQALADLEHQAGTRFEPRVVRLFTSEYEAHGDAIFR